MKWEENLISIVVPVYNAERYVEEAIRSIFAQTFRDWELILVDDGSTDASPEILGKYEGGKVRVFRMGENRGQAAARNFGRAQARGRYLAYQDADDLWSSEKLEREFCFLKEKGCAFAFTGYEFAGEDGVRNGKVVHVPETIGYRQALKNTTISTITVMFDREKIPESLMEMPSGVRGEDSATWWQILRAGYTAYGLDEPLSVYRRHAQSHSGNKLKAVWGTYKMYRECEKLSVPVSCWYFLCYLYHAVMRRL